MLNPVHLDEKTRRLPSHSVSPIASGSRPSTVTRSVRPSATRIGRRRFVMSVRLAVARKSAQAPEAPSEPISPLRMRWPCRRPRSAPRRRRWGRSRVELHVELEAQLRPCVGPVRPRRRATVMFPSPSTWLAFGASVPAGSSTHGPAAHPRVEAAHDHLDAWAPGPSSAKQFAAPVVRAPFQELNRDGAAQRGPARLNVTVALRISPGAASPEPETIELSRTVARSTMPAEPPATRTRSRRRRRRRRRLLVTVTVNEAVAGPAGAVADGGGDRVDARRRGDVADERPRPGSRQGAGTRGRGDRERETRRKARGHGRERRAFRVLVDGGEDHGAAEAVAVLHRAVERGQDRDRLNGEVRLGDVEEDVPDRLDLDPGLQSWRRSAGSTGSEPSLAVAAARTCAIGDARRPPTG